MDEDRAARSTLGSERDHLVTEGDEPATQASDRLAASERAVSRQRDDKDDAHWRD
jgi:hypothetical protein